MEGGKERGGAVPFIVMGHRPAPPLLQGESRLGPLQGLDLTFLIHAEDDGMLGRVEIQSHDILQFLLEVWIPTELKGADPVGLQTMSGPDPMHECGVRPQVPRQGAGGPVGGGGRRRLGRRLQNACGQRLARLGGPPPAGGILGEAGQALGGEALPPEPHGLPTRVQHGGNLVVVVACGRQQRNLGAEHESRGRPPSASPLLQMPVFGFSHLKSGGNAHGPILL